MRAEEGTEEFPHCCVELGAMEVAATDDDEDVVLGADEIWPGTAVLVGAVDPGSDDV